MAQCVVIVGGAVVQSAADPCTGFVILTPAEYEYVSANPFKLSVEEASLIGGAVAAAWVTAWAFLAIARMFRPHGAQME